MKFRAIFACIFALLPVCYPPRAKFTWELKTELPDGPGIPNSEDTYKYCGTCTDLLEKENNNGFT